MKNISAPTPDTVSPLAPGSLADFNRYRPLWLIAALYLALSLMLRIVLWGAFGITADITPTQVPGILLVGALNDAIQLIYLLLPLSLYLFLVPMHGLANRGQRAVLGVGMFVMIYGMLYLCVAEFYFFEEYDARFNLVAVNYLMYSHEVLINIRDSYPVYEVLGANLILSALLLRLLWPLLRNHTDCSLPITRRATVLVGHILLAIITAAVFNTDSLNASTNRVTRELTANGISSLFRALHNSGLDYDLYYRTGDSGTLFKRLAEDLSKGGGRFTRLDEGRLDRQFPARADGLGKLNVVVLVEESFGAEFIGAYGDERGLTPAFDALAKQGLLFRNAYATGTRTVRGLEAITASFPPIPSESIIKRKGSEGISNWGGVMRKQGYRTSFLYGGYGYFDNMNHFFASNGFSVSDRKDIENPDFANIWGVSDLSLFRHAADYFDKEHASGAPFFSIIMSTSNHKPYTFAPGTPGVPEKGGGRLAGVRYADYALGEFIKMAETRPWFNDTLFVIVADHGARVYGKAQIPLGTYEIPMLLYSPAHIPAREESALASQMDLAPTVLGLLGFEYRAPFFGQDVLHQKGEHTLLFNHNYKVATYRDERLTLLSLRHAVESYHYDKDENRFTAVPLDAEAVELTTAYFQTGFELFKQHRY